MRRNCSLLTVLALSALPACGDRADIWDDVPTQLTAAGLAHSVALLDIGAERALMLTAKSDLTLDEPVAVPIGRGYAGAATTADGNTLVVLSRGDVPRTKKSDQGPVLTTIADGAEQGTSYDLGDPLSGLTLDPESRFAVVYPSDTDNSFVENPNELSIIDITKPAGTDNPTPLTLRSFGGRPRSFFFTPTLGLPEGPRRLLTVLTDQDVGIIDLSEPAKGDITVRLSSSDQTLTPVQIAVTDGQPGVTNDARLAIRVADDSGVILVDLLPVPDDETQLYAHSFRPTPNVVFAGGVPSDIAFVNTDGGLRLAALVPSQNMLSLIDPGSGIATNVALGGYFQHLSLVTDIVGPTVNGADIALLWAESSTSIAFVALGSTVGKPYKSVDTLELEEPVVGVHGVPKPNDRLKILAASNGSTYFVLDLVARTASPINVTGGADLSVAPDGKRAWLYSPNQSQIASLDLADLHPRNVILASPIAAAFDVARQDGGRALFALHSTDGVGITVLNSALPSLETAVDYSSILLGGLP